MNKLIAILLFLAPLAASAQRPIVSDIEFKVQQDPTGKALVKWSLSNNSKQGIYLYDFFLWGPSPWVERTGNRVVLGTAPIREEATCPPNRVAPVLLIVVAPGRTIQGDFVDDQLKLEPKANVSMRVAVFGDPYKVVEEAKRFSNSNCKHSPYDAIVREGTIIESNSVQFP